MMDPSESPILIDVSAGYGVFDREMLERMGHAVMVCHGPDAEENCPILEKGGGCQKVDDAHGVAFELDLDREQHRDILKRYQEVIAEGVPIRVLVREGQDEQYSELLEGVEVWTHEPNVSELDGFSARVEAYERTELI
jgi:hypothetical protein